MRIALFPDDYLPDSTLVHAKMFHELALELKLLGHHPVVITPGRHNQTVRLKVDYHDNIEVWRFRCGKRRGCSKVQRAMNETLLSWNAWLAIRKKVKEEPFNACINYSPTIFFGPLLLWFKGKYKTVNYLVLRDLFPQWIIDEGLIKHYSPIAFYFRVFVRITGYSRWLNLERCK